VQIVWFKRDLRVFDHTPLSLASKNGTILPIFIFEPELWRKPDHSYRHYMFLREALRDLEKQLKSLGANLTILVGNAVDVFDKLNSQYKINSIFSYEETWNLWTYDRDTAVRSWASDNKVEWIESPKNGVFRNLGNRNGWSRNWYETMSAALTPTPKKIKSTNVKSDNIPEAIDLNLSTKQACSFQTATRLAAIDTLNSFLYSRGHNYTFEMSSPITAENSCSRISPYLAFGQISVREAYQLTEKRLRELRGVDTKYSKSLESFSSRLRWHCHFTQKLEDQPNIETNTLHSSFENLRPSFGDNKFLNSWENGTTGYPMIDACMRYLNATGWLNFRMRAMLVSFASYHLWLDWRQTASHLARQFLDYEPGIHYSQIQMQSGTTGMNSIRIYNPIKQGMDQDPDGKFIRKWVPELKDIPKQFIHQPWLLENSSLSYPNPIVDEKLARTAAQEKIYSLKKQIKNSVETASLIHKHASRLNRRPRRKLKASIPVKQQLSLDL
jgi:deoxyribodipyrimidine photo-lyase